MISQCMIVKNEEKLIERALSWGREIMCEQIVVDTGSTDRTKELAERAGAKVFDFQWIDDFSAAKNFALEQAKGDWIVFLDADEYMSAKSVQGLKNSIKKVSNLRKNDHEIKAIECKLINVNDEMKPVNIIKTVRVHRNDISIRYMNAIHEYVVLNDDDVIGSNDFEIIHDGYTAAMIKEKNKNNRNIRLLGKELNKDPENLNLKIYLADCLKHSEDVKDLEQAESYYREAVEADEKSAFKSLRVKAYVYFLNEYVNNPEKLDESESMTRKALKEYPNYIDFEYFLASIYNYRGKYKEAWSALVDCERRLGSNSFTDDSLYVKADMTMLYAQMIMSAQGLGNTSDIIHYAIKTLCVNKERTDILCPLLGRLCSSGLSEDEVLEKLKPAYNLKSPADLLIIAKAAKSVGAIPLAQKIVQIAGEIMQQG